MKRAIYLSILGVITAICIVFGIVRSIGRFADGIWKNDPGNMVTLEPQSLDAFEKMDFDTEVLSVDITEGEGYAISYTAKEKLVPEYRVENGTLYVKQEKVKGFKDGVGSKMHVVITVPKGICLKNIDICANVGDVKIEDIQTEQFSCDADVGNIEIRNSSLGEAEITADVGNIDIKKTKLQDTEMEADVGDINLEDVELQNTQITADVGKVKMDVNGNRQDYSLDLEAEFGDIEVDGKRYSSHVKEDSNEGYQIAVTGSMGDIRVNFN